MKYSLSGHSVNKFTGEGEEEIVLEFPSNGLYLVFYDSFYKQLRCYDVENDSVILPIRDTGYSNTSTMGEFDISSNEFYYTRGDGFRKIDSKKQIVKDFCKTLPFPLIKPTITTSTGIPFIFNSDKTKCCFFNYQYSPYNVILDTSDYKTQSFLATQFEGSPYLLKDTLISNKNRVYFCISHSLSPFNSVYSFSNWSRVATANPTNQIAYTSYLSNSKYYILSTTSTPYLHIYNQSDWSKINNTPTSSSYPISISVNDQETYLVCSYNVSPYVRVYNTSNWSSVPIEAAPGGCLKRQGSFNSSGSLFAFISSSTTNPRLIVYNTNNWSILKDINYYDVIKHKNFYSSTGNICTFTDDDSLFKVYGAPVWSTNYVISLVDFETTNWTVVDDTRVPCITQIPQTISSFNLDFYKSKNNWFFYIKNLYNAKVTLNLSKFKNIEATGLYSISDVVKFLYHTKKDDIEYYRFIFSNYYKTSTYVITLKDGFHQYPTSNNTEIFTKFHKLNPSLVPTFLIENFNRTENFKITYKSSSGIVIGDLNTKEFNTDVLYSHCDFKRGGFYDNDTKFVASLADATGSSDTDSYPYLVVFNTSNWSVNYSESSSLNRIMLDLFYSIESLPFDTYERPINSEFTIIVINNYLYVLSIAFSTSNRIYPYHHKTAKIDLVNKVLDSPNIQAAGFYKYVIRSKYFPTTGNIYFIGATGIYGTGYTKCNVSNWTLPETNLVYSPYCGYVLDGDVNSDETRLALLTYWSSYTIRVYDISSGSPSIVSTIPVTPTNNQSLGWSLRYDPTDTYVYLVPDIYHVRKYFTSDWTYSEYTISPTNTGEIYSSELSPDGTQLVLASAYELRSYNTSDFSVIYTTSVYSWANGYTHLKFSPDGLKFTVTTTTTSYMYTVGSSTWTKSTAVYPSQGQIQRFSFSPNRSFFVVSTFSTPYLSIYNGSTFSWIQNLSSANYPDSLFTHIQFLDENTFYGITSSNTLVTYDTSTWTKTVRSNFAWYGTGYLGGNSVCTNSSYAVFSENGPYSLLNISSSPWKKEFQNWYDQGTGSLGDVNASGTLLANFNYNSPFLTIYNMSDYSVNTTLGDQSVRGKFNSSGTQLVVALESSPFIKIYNTSDWSTVSSIQPVPSKIYDIKFNSSSSKLYVTTDPNAEGSLRVLRVYNSSDWSVAFTSPVMLTGYLALSVSDQIVAIKKTDTFNKGLGLNQSDYYTELETARGGLIVYNASNMQRILTNPEFLYGIGNSSVGTQYIITINSSEAIYRNVVSGNLRFINISTSPWTLNWTKSVESFTSSGGVLSIQKDSLAKFLILSLSSSPWIVVYDTSSWNLISITGSTPSSLIKSMGFSPEGDYFSLYQISSPYILMYSTSDWSSKSINFNIDHITTNAGIGFIQT